MARMGEGFRFRKVMAWSPAILILMGALNMAAGDTLEGALVALAGIVFGLVVKRRARQHEDRPHTRRDPVGRF
jgi:hypothetical protein